ncbi:hypothetical protein BJY04DRAFT_215063 [Aspergillus karnatakaensis]|uniref:uncharacterized protein n=1 Tax=Aspergillus karnatakaensis TaxID=1810916 RepID=UPI003CCD5A9E
MATQQPIALIGTGCRFPGGASSPSRLWDILQQPKDLATRIPSERFEIDAFYNPKPSTHAATNTQKSYFLKEDVRCFDAPFFNISASEAESIDPQQRVLLETIYEALEAGGQRPKDLAGSNTGVYCGLAYEDYASIVLRDLDALPRYTATGTSRAMASNRASYFFDWRGPSITLDTACSSGLVALHLAAQALRNGDCTLAVAAGMNLILAPNVFISESKLNMLSPTGHCRMWDASADGYARGEGVAALVLKRLDDAIADGDPIECVIRATNVNQDGRTMGITMPSRTAQLELIRDTYAKAGLDPTSALDRCQYFEAHGTGTPAGDPEEAHAIHEAFFPAGADTSETPLFVGSVKTVIGHTEATAGIAGVVKACLSMNHGLIAPNLYFESLNPDISAYGARLRVPTKLHEWPKLPPGVPRRASVNSFGFGGTNAHVILESFEPVANELGLSLQDPQCSIPVVLPLVFSATSDKSLGANLENYAGFLSTNADVSLNDLAWSLLCRRGEFSYKWRTYAGSVAELRSKIQTELELRKSGSPSTIVSRPGSKQSRILGIFTGQGAQWPTMGAELLSMTECARGWLDELQTSLDTLPAEYRPAFSLVEELSRSKEASRVERADLSQPLCTAVQIMLVNVLRTLGIGLDVVIGHSSGEIAAAYANGIITASDAIRIAHLRGYVVKLAGRSGRPGAMIAAGLSVEEAETLCRQESLQGRIRIAAVNSPSSVTLSGDADAVQEVETLLKSEGKFARTLRVDTAYHSHHMMPCAEPYLRALQACGIKPTIPSSTGWFSTVYCGEEMTSARSPEMQAQYWVDNLVGRVSFAPTLAAIIQTETPFDMILEIGPHAALKGPVLQTLSAMNSTAAPPYAALLNRGDSAIATVADAIGSFWTYLSQSSYNLEAYHRLFHPHMQRPYFLRNLPTYPFDHSTPHWAESRVSRALLHNKAPRNQLLGRLTPDSMENEWRWRNYLRIEDTPWLADHSIQGQTVLPASGVVAMALEAVRIVSSAKQVRLVELCDLRFRSAIPITEAAGGTETVFVLRASGSHGSGSQLDGEGETWRAEFTVAADIGGCLKCCAEGSLEVGFGRPDSNLLAPGDPRIEDMRDVNVAAWYSSVMELGHGYSGPFRGIQSLKRKGQTAHGALLSTGGVSRADPFVLHPALLESVLQALLAASGFPSEGLVPDAACIPVQIGRIYIHGNILRAGSKTANGLLSCAAAVTEHSRHMVTGDADLCDSNGMRIVQLEDICFSSLTTTDSEHDGGSLFELVWGPLHPDAAEPYNADSDCTPSSRLADLDRIARFYLADATDRLTLADREGLDPHRARFAAWVDSALALADSGQHEPDHDSGSVDTLLDSEDLTPVEKEVMQVVGGNTLSYLRGQTSMTALLRENNLLERFYNTSPDFAAYHAQLAHVAGQLAFRFPRMRILDVGVGTAATRAIVDTIGQSCHTYTFTAPAEAPVAELQGAFIDYPGQSIYRVLDLGQDLCQQGFEENAYDLVVAPHILHETSTLETTLAHLRRLLKPGGHLLFMGATNTSALWVLAIFGAFQSWWRSSKGTHAEPIIGVKDWDTALKAAGFSGVDTITPSYDTSARPFSVLVSQAVDDRITFLRDPLAQSAAGCARVLDELLVIGGSKQGNKTSALATQLGRTLLPYFARTTIYPSLDAIELSLLGGRITVINLSDLENPQADHFNHAPLVQLLSERSFRLLWLSGESGPHPMSKALLRVLAHDNPESRYQHLQIVGASPPDLPDIIATTVLRLASNESANDCSLTDCVWSTEPELLLENGTMKIPRFRRAMSNTLRHSESQQAVYENVNAEGACVDLIQSDHLELTIRQPPAAAPSHVQVSVEFSLRMAVVVEGVGFLHLVVGRDVQTSRRVLALTTQHSPLIATPAPWLISIPQDLSKEQVAGLLERAASCLIAVCLVKGARAGTAILLHEADSILREAVTLHAPTKQISPYFSTSFAEKRAAGTIVLHPLSSNRTLKAVLPPDISMLVHVGEQPSRLFTRLKSVVGADVRIESVETFYSLSSTVVTPSPDEIARARQMLDVATELAEIIDHPFTSDFLHVHDLPLKASDIPKSTIVEWTNARRVSVRVEPATATVTLSPDATYLILNLSTTMARSVAEWMVCRGARTIVVARRPSEHEPPLDGLSVDGVSVIPVTLTWNGSRSLLSLHQRIAEDLPPVGGVICGPSSSLDGDGDANGPARELSAEFLRSMTGIADLDALYGDSDMTLDFFIFYGSTLEPLGNHDYAANCAEMEVMSSLIRGRRAQRLAGSIIQVADRLPLSAADLHEYLSEAVVAGRASSTGSGELLVAPRAVGPAGQDPRFWHLAEEKSSCPTRTSMNQLDDSDKSLEQASSVREARDIIEAKFTKEIRRRLQVPTTETITQQTLLVELGMDSLVAIDLRTWFSKELGVNIPTLMILGGASVGDLTDYACANSELVKGLRDGQPLKEEGLASGSENGSLPTPSSPSTLTGTSETDGDAGGSSSETGSSSSSPSPSPSALKREKDAYERTEELSFAQSRYWFLEQFYDDRTAHNVTFLFKLNAAPDVARLESAIRHVVTRHESLRTCFIHGTSKTTGPLQAILRHGELQLEQSDVQDDQDITREFQAMRTYIYELSRGETVRIRLITTATGGSFLLLGWHHIVLDGASLHILISELGAAYMRQALPPAPRRYTDFAAAQRKSFKNGDMAKDLAYWKAEFATIPEPLPLLPMARTRVREGLKRYDVQDLKMEIPSSTMQAIRAACKKTRVSPFQFFLAALRTFLARLTNADEFCIGVADSNRFDPANAGIAGFLLNFIPVRFNADIHDRKFEDVLVDTREKVYKALQHSAVPFDKLLDELGAPRSTAYNPLFQVLLDWQPQTGDEYRLGDIEMAVERFQPAQTAYDLTLLIAEASTGAAIVHFRLQTSLYDGHGAELIAHGFTSLVELLARDHGQVVKDLAIYDSVVEGAAELGKGPSLRSVWPSTISRRIDEVSERFLHHLAVKDTEGRTFTYGQLTERTSLLANVLLRLEIPTGSRVCLFMHPSAEWVWCMLAIWRLGLVYVPLDLRNPVERLATMVQDCEPQVILCERETEKNVAGLGSPASQVINISSLNSQCKISAVENRSMPDNPAAVLYTSGTTGRPKGIQLRHSGIRSQVEGYVTRWEIGQEVVLQQGAMTFNHSLDQMLVALCNGGRLVVVARSLRGDPVSLTRLIVNEQITYTKATPSEYSMWLQYGSETLQQAARWRFAFGGGEHFTTSLAKRFQALELPQLRVFNSYGPGEITISSHKMEINYRSTDPVPGNIYPVGYSLPNYSTYIVDQSLRCVPQGVSGEVLIAGSGPCMGYLHLDSLNKERFIQNPVTDAEYVGQGWTTAYRTFDRGHLLADGSLVIEGRLDGDTQIKLRGIRMELEDIENALLCAADGSLIRAIVSLRGDSESHQFLAAHIVFASNFKGNVSEALTALKKSTSLPQYMTPSVIAPVDELPLNVHGKVDRRAVALLPLPNVIKGKDTSEGGTATATEHNLLSIWGDVLGDVCTNLSSIDSSTDFFLIGGSSVLLVKLQALLNAKLGVAVQLMQLFENSTLGEMARVIEGSATKPAQSIDWQAETSIDDLPLHQLPLQSSPTSSPAPNTHTVILTGATGFLGKTIIKILTSTTNIHIHAIATRPRTPSTKRTLPTSHPNLTVHTGDLGTPLFGLSPETITSLASQATVIIHTAAHRSFWDEYATFRAANVTGLKTLVALAQPRRIPIHFLSSGLLKTLSLAADSGPETESYEGYLASKWAGERVLLNAARMWGVPVTCHRPMHGEISESSGEFISEVCELAKQMRCRPVEGGWEGTFCFVRVMALGEAVGRSALGTDTDLSPNAKTNSSLGEIVNNADGEGERGIVPCFHIKEHRATVRVGITDIVTAVREQEGFDGFDTLGIVHWMGKAKREYGFQWFPTSHDAVVGEGGARKSTRV